MPRSTKLRVVQVRIKGKLFHQVIAPAAAGKGWTRRTFKNKAEANALFEHLSIELANRGSRGLAFSDTLRFDALAAVEILAPFRVTLTDAARAYAAAHERELKSETVQNAISYFLTAKEIDGARPRYLKDLRERLGRFGREFGERKVASVSAGEIHDWLSGLGLAPLTRNTFGKRLSVFWSFAVTRGWTNKNVLCDVPKAKVRDTAIGILKPEELARVLEAAAPETLPYWLLGSFAGLRSAELERLEWKDIHFESGLVEVPALKSKTASRRFVEIQPNLIAWLTPYRESTGKIAPRNLGNRLASDRSVARLPNPWPVNALRHSYASYHLAHFQNAAALALQLGHTNQDLIFRHYRELVRPAAAKQYWNIFPAQSSVGKIVALSA
jgi:integrase